jgi:regulator of sigma E protease
VQACGSALIVLAGPLANLLIAVAIFAAFNARFGVPSNPAIVRVCRTIGRRTAGMQEGDRIVAIDGSKVEDFQDLAVTNVSESIRTRQCR